MIAFLATASLGAIWSSCSPDFGPGSVVDRFAQIEPKVLFCVDGYRYGGKDFDRLDTIAEIAATDPEPRADRGRALPERLARALSPRGAPDRRADELEPAARPRLGRRALLRARPLRPSPLGPLLVGHHRPAEGDRPGPRRHPARAAEEGLPAPRRQDRRPRLLVHDDRLDDVELPGRRPPHPGLDRPLRRQPRHPGHGRPLGPRGAHRHDLLRHQRRLHRRLHEGRRRAEQRPRPLAPALRRLDRLPPLARGLPVGLRPRRRGHLALLHQRRHRPLHRLRGRRPPAPRLPRRAPGPRARRQGRGLRRRRQLR